MKFITLFFNHLTKCRKINHTLCKSNFFYITGLKQFYKNLFTTKCNALRSDLLKGWTFMP